ncbi:enoyl-CoA hydratase [Varunaivibrio sulfuroxidans]|uniref:enoyl-CoA hydratase n=1 Tax=Varunaivibrio sulfuroxidans TaxID=1773489 RepID=A0A4V2UPG2_9PROT|nr:enoyl-CoA hydratase [Varunaivibrio sulfuroxidans]TCS65121.1 short chain enoyl-CoA hydratase [Varunaivibrio sulfuroxidans]WES29592.1 enoyl-CoA hydratase [Varunaivibrio sulfuroxidans]
MTFENILYDKDGAVVVITLNRPEALNALNGALMTELAQALDGAEGDPDVGAVVLTGSPKAFAAGADIKEMADKTFMDCYLEDFITGTWERVARCRLPVIAAVAGYALGGGCELAMMCDIIIAADNAKFGQPEITLGIIPGIGGTQRLVRAVGKAKAGEMILSGRIIDAVEAERAGLVSRVVAADALNDEALQTARKIAELSRPAVMMAKESMAAAFEAPLSHGLRHERRLFHALFAGEDQKEGMAAFIEKRRPVFKNR